MGAGTGHRGTAATRKTEKQLFGCFSGCIVEIVKLPFTILRAIFGGKKGGKRR